MSYINQRRRIKKYEFTDMASSRNFIIGITFTKGRYLEYCNGFGNGYNK